MLCDAAVLRVAADAISIEDVSAGRGQTPYCHIDRVSMAVSHHATPLAMESSADQRSIHGIVGTINLISGPYLVVITDRRQVGFIYQHAVWELAGVEYVPFARNRRHLSPTQVRIEDRYLGMVRSVFETTRMYFSYSYDLTHGLQRLHTSGEQFYSEPLHKRMDRRFCWNDHLLAGLARSGGMQPYLLPVVAGFVRILGRVDVNGHSVEVTLISRRAARRAGTRFNRRGIDRGGAVANFVETEQIVQVDGNYHLAYVQTRGSVPLFWAQTPTLRYKPPVELIASEDHELAARRHFTEQLRHYGKQSVVNLINTTGHEGMLNRSFGDLMTKLHSPHLGYYPFDFHKECSRLRWHRLSLLMDQIRQDHRVYGAFMAKRDGDVVQIESFQQGVFRTNCIDCLDRSNVVQSLIAKEALETQLRQLSVLPAGESVDDHKQLKSQLDAVWADNADALSVQYAGSLALKTDFTRTGKRTVRGLLSDAWQSALRYYANNMTDGDRQDAVDLFLGNYQVQPGEGVAVPSPVVDAPGPASRAAPLLALFAVVMLLMLLSVIRVESGDGDGASGLLSAAKWALWALAVAGAALVYRFSDRIVNQPVLVPRAASLTGK